MLDTAKSLVKRLPYVSELHKQMEKLKAELRRWRTWQPPGHFYSPIPSLDEVRADRKRIFEPAVPALGAVDLNVPRQLELLETFAPYHGSLPAEWLEKGAARYYFANEYYSWADAIVLHCMLRHRPPSRLVEIGSGFSSAVVLDTDDAYLGRTVQCTFIEPYPERLQGLLKNEDWARVRLLEKRVQDVDLEIFASLRANDILLVDSSHVSKTGSDLNRILFEILPVLAPSVRVHFHDIFYPFEYPESWVLEGVAWNEAYLLHAFLQYNSVFAVEFFTSYIVQCHREKLKRSLPLALNSEREAPSLTDAPGASLWIVRKAADGDE
jgi:hypothetical protein